MQCFNDTYCYDSDGGISPYIKGYVMNGTNGTIKWDSCNSAIVLNEYYCDENNAEVTKINCTDGCSDGRCKTTVLKYPFNITNKTF